MAEKNPNPTPGLFASLTEVAGTLVGIVHTRLHLLSIDLEEDRDRILSLLALGLVALFCFGVGVILGTLLLIVAFWDTHRLLVLGVLTGSFLAIGITALIYAIYKIRTMPKLFAASMTELLKDKQQLGIK